MRAFYSKEINPDLEQKIIGRILSRYPRIPLFEKLKKNIYKKLSCAKARGTTTILFKIVMRKDQNRKHRNTLA